MSKILSRDEFGMEVSKFKNGEEVNEGLFQFLKSFFKQDWQSIKSKNPSIKSELEKIDKGLDSFTVLKRSNYDACNQFRQALCDFANDLLDGKLDELENEKSLKKVVMGLSSDEDKMKNKIKESPEITSILGDDVSIKSKKLKEKLQDSSNSVEDIIKKNPAITPWADAMKRSIKNLINDIIILKSDDDDKEVIEKTLDKKKKEDEKWLEEHCSDWYKSQDKKIKELEKFREDTLKHIGITPMKGMDGNKAVNTLCKEYVKIIDVIGLKESVEYDNKLELNESSETELIDKINNALNGDNHFGLQKIIEIINKNYDDKTKPKKNDLIKIYLKKLSDIYGKISKSNKVFADVPSDGVQAMFAGISYSVAYGLIGDNLFKDTKIKKSSIIELLARCCIEKDATIGYSFPLVNEKKPKNGTIYVYLMGQLKEENEKSGIFNEFKDLLNVFKKNIEKLFNEILEKAKKIKEENDKQKEKEAEELKKKEEEESNKKD